MDESSESCMSTVFPVIWGLALLAIVVLLLVLRRTLRGQTRANHTDDPDLPVALATDTLLFYHEQDSVQRTADKHVTVHIPGAAWEAQWSDDLLRLQVSELPSLPVALPPELGPLQVLAVFDLKAYRMTEIGTDVEIAHFADVIRIVLASQGHEGNLGVAVHSDSTWVLAAPAEVPPRIWDRILLPSGDRGIAASLVRPGRVCLVRLGIDQ